MYLLVILILNVILFVLLIVCVSVWKSDSPSSVFPESGGGERGSPGRLSLGDGESLSMSPNSGGVGAGGGSPGSLKVPGAGPSTGGLGRIARLLVKDTSRGGEESYRRRTHSLERYASQSLHTHIHTHGQSVTHSLTYIITPSLGINASMVDSHIHLASQLTQSLNSYSVRVYISTYYNLLIRFFSNDFHPQLFFFFFY